jgi:predicted  nucleic acid-binding Zn-ribbon protein
MIEGLINVMTPRPQGISADESDANLEKVALAGAAAIQRIVADRDELRNRSNVQQRELVALSAINEDLRRRIALIRHHYVELGTRILAQLEQFDQAFREAMRDTQETAAAPSEHANLVALAHRLKPNTGASRSGEGRD